MYPVITRPIGWLNLLHATRQQLLVYPVITRPIGWLNLLHATRQQIIIIIIIIGTDALY